jgi:hypothetical protein
MGPLMVVKANPVTNDPTSVLQGLNPVAMYALILQGAEHPLGNPPDRPKPQVRLLYVKRINQLAICSLSALSWA